MLQIFASFAPHALSRAPTPPAHREITFQNMVPCPEFVARSAAKVPQLSPQFLRLVACLRRCLRQSLSHSAWITAGPRQNATTQSPSIQLDAARDTTTQHMRQSTIHRITSHRSTAQRT